MTDTRKKELREQVESALDTVRPYLKEDGGNVELVEVSDDMSVKIKFTGNCESCSMSFMTLKAGIEQAVKSAVPEIKEVVSAS